MVRLRQVQRPGSYVGKVDFLHARNIKGHVSVFAPPSLARSLAAREGERSHLSVNGAPAGANALAPKAAPSDAGS